MAWVVRQVWSKDWLTVPVGMWLHVITGCVLDVSHGAPLVVNGCLSLDGVVRVSNVGTMDGGADPDPTPDPDPAPDPDPDTDPDRPWDRIRCRTRVLSWVWSWSSPWRRHHGITNGGGDVP